MFYQSTVKIISNPASTVNHIMCFFVWRTFSVFIHRILAHCSVSVNNQNSVFSNNDLFVPQRFVYLYFYWPNYILAIHACQQEYFFSNKKNYRLILEFSRLETKPSHRKGCIFIPTISIHLTKKGMWIVQILIFKMIN